MEKNRIPLWFSLSDNTHDIVVDIMRNGPVSRSKLARDHRLSAGTLSKITSELIYQKIIDEQKTPQEDRKNADQEEEIKEGIDYTEGLERQVARDGANGRGRPQVGLMIHAESRTYIGINVHTFESVMMLTDAMCRPLTDPLIVSYTDTRPTAIVDALSGGIRQLIQKAEQAGLSKPSAVGITVGGHIVEDNTVTYAPFLRWNGPVKLGDMIQDRCQIPTAIFNDLDSLLVYESWFGSGRGMQRFALVTIGLGIGYALCEGGQSVDYPDKSYGLAGHVLVDPDGPTCSAGHKGCSQCLTSPSLAMEYSQLMGQPMSFDDFAANVEAGKPIARHLIENSCYRLGVLLSTIANMAMPEKILIGGEAAHLATTAMESIRTGITRYRHSQAQPVAFEILSYEWEQWALGGASRVIALSILK